MFKWIKKGGKNVSGNMVDGGKSLLGAESIIETSNEIKNMAKKVLSPKDTIKNARKETFKEALSRQNVSDLELIQIYKNYVYIFYISVVFSVMLFVLLLYKLFIQQQVFISFSILVFLVFCLASCFKYSFRSFQIKHQKLCSIMEWWNRPNDWFPPFK